MKTIIWIDDLRNPYFKYDKNKTYIEEYSYYKGEDSYVIWVKSYKQFISILKELYDKNEYPDEICFDHDLGGNRSGYDCAKYLVNFCIDNNLKLPKYECHSSNPAGKSNILSILDNFNNI